MRVDARPASTEDIDRLESLYRGLAEEMTVLHAMWPVADGLTPPIREALLAALADSETLVVMGTIDEIPFGFLVIRVEPVADGSTRIGSIRLVFVEPEAREVGVGEAMRELALTRLRDRGITKFDAHVLPGHRLVKNFFESAGFAARSIVMHHDDDR